MRKWIRRHKVITSVISILLVIVTVFGISLAKDGGFILDKATNGVVTSGSTAVTEQVTGFKGFIRGVFNYRNVLAENEALRRENEELKLQVSDNELSQRQLSELRDLSKALNYSAAERGGIVSADIASFDGTTWINSFTINRGADDGIKVDNVVICGEGLVGRVTETGGNWAKVVSVADDNNNTSFYVSRNSGILGMLSGDGRGGLTGYVFNAQAGIIEGDVLKTSGMGIYPAGISIGTVSAVEYNSDTQLKVITVEPEVDFKGITKVMVII